MTPAAVFSDFDSPPLDPRWVASVPAERIPAVMGQLAAAMAQLAAREMVLSGNGHGSNPARGSNQTKAAVADEWLTVPQAAERYHISQSWLYRNAKRLGFGRKLGAKLLVSVRRLEEHLDRGLSQ